MNEEQGGATSAGGMVPADLAPERVLSLLATKRYGRSLEVLARTGSTNDDARAATSAPDGHVIVADAQDAGRGSRGRSWSSPPGSDLYFSVVARLSASSAGSFIAAMPPSSVHP